MEKRLYERISAPIKLTYEVKNRPKIAKESIGKNISGSGICLSLSEKLLPRSEILMKVTIGHSNAVNLRGKIVWSRRVEILEKTGPIVYYDTGVELINADLININRIITHFYGKSF